MSLWRSADGGFRSVGWRGVFAGVLGVWLLPAVLGAAVLGLHLLIGPEGAIAARAWSGALLLLLSPLISWLGYLIALPVVAALLRQGWFGWVPALLTGVTVGGGLGIAMQHPIALPFASLTFTMLRGLLGQLYPAAFRRPVAATGVIGHRGGITERPAHDPCWPVRQPRHPPYRHHPAPLRPALQPRHPLGFLRCDGGRED